MKKTLIVLLLILTYFPVRAQVAVNTDVLQLTPEQQKADFQLLVDVLDQYHPSPYRFVSRDSMQRSAAVFLSGLSTPLSDREFQLVVRRFITQVHCGHTVALPSAAWYENQRGGRANILPFIPLIVGDGLYFPRGLTSDSLAAGKEILSINGRNSSAILNDMRAIHTRDGYSETFTDQSIRDVFQTYYIFLYGNQAEYTIVYRSGNDTRTAVVKTAADIVEQKTPPRRAFEDYRKAVSTSWSNLYINDADSMAVLHITGFGGGHFKKYYRKVFRTLKKEQIPNLVIDVRDNGGGYFPNGNRLLRYLSKEKFTFRFSRAKEKPEKNRHMSMGVMSRMTKSLFKTMPDPVDDKQVRTYEIKCKPKKNRFDGRLYVLMNGGSFSMSGHVSAFLQHHTEALMIGEETGGGEEGSNALLFYELTLPESGVRVNVPYYHLDHQLPGVTSGRGVMPDIAISYSVEDLLKGEDLELKTVLAEVRKYNTYRGQGRSER